jgi:hypothetical protein
MEPRVDRVVSALEAALLPELERRANAIKIDPQFAEPKVVSLRHAPVAHTIALACRPVRIASPDAVLALSIQVTAVSGLCISAFVLWQTTTKATIGKPWDNVIYDGSSLGCRGADRAAAPVRSVAKGHSASASIL